MFSACGHGLVRPSAAPVPLGREFTLEVGQSALVDDSGLRVTLLGVADDSRCPTDVQCVWEGDARVAVAVASTEAASRLTKEVR